MIKLKYEINPEFTDLFTGSKETLSPQGNVRLEELTKFANALTTPHLIETSSSLINVVSLLQKEWDAEDEKFRLEETAQKVSQSSQKNLQTKKKALLEKKRAEKEEFKQQVTDLFAKKFPIPLPQQIQANKNWLTLALSEAIPENKINWTTFFTKLNEIKLDIPLQELTNFFYHTKTRNFLAKNRHIVSEEFTAILQTITICIAMKKKNK